MFLPAHGRSRIATDLTVSDSEVTFSAGGGVTVPDTNLYWTSWSHIYDFPRRGISGAKAHVLPVEQVSIKALQPLVLRSWTGGVGTVNVVSNGSCGLDAGIPAYLMTVLVPPVSEQVWVENSLNAFLSFSDQFPEEVSLGNFIFELRDLADSIAKVFKVITKLKQAGVFSRNQNRRVGSVKRAVDDLQPFNPKTVASVYLDYSFNWAPLVKDLKAIFGLCASVTSRIDFLKRTKGKPFKLGYSQVIPAEMPLSHNIDSGPGGFITEMYIEDYECRYRAGTFVFQDLTHLDDFYGLLRAYMGKTGLNNPLKVAWNAIPFSFILDWIVPVSSYLALFKIQGADGRWDLFDLTCSVKQSCRIRIVQTDRVTSQSAVIGIYDFRRYTRLTDLPLRTSGLPPIHALNTKQLSLLLAMST